MLYETIQFEWRVWVQGSISKYEESHMMKVQLCPTAQTEYFQAVTSRRRLYSKSMYCATKLSVQLELHQYGYPFNYLCTLFRLKTACAAYFLTLSQFQIKETN